MRRATMTVAAEMLMVGLQLAAVLLILGVPDVRAATDVVSSGVASAQNTVALITALLWAGSLVLAVAVVAHGARTVSRGRRSSLLPVVALAVGLCCLSAGIIRHQAASFHPCCGSLIRAQSLLESSR